MAKLDKKEPEAKEFFDLSKEFPMTRKVGTTEVPHEENVKLAKLAYSKLLCCMDTTSQEGLVNFNMISKTTTNGVNDPRKAWECLLNKVQIQYKSQTWQTHERVLHIDMWRPQRPRTICFQIGNFEEQNSQDEKWKNHH